MEGEDSRKSVVMATRIFAPEPAAASFRLEAVANALLDEGGDVTVLTSNYGSAPNEQDIDPSTRRGRVLRWPVLRDKTGYLRGYLPYLSFDVPLLYRLVGTRNADVVLVEPPPTTGFFVRIASRVTGMPYVWYAADVWSDATKIAGAPMPVVVAVRMLERFAIKGATGVIAVSEGVAQRVRDLGGHNVVVIPNGIDTSIYHSDGAVLTEPELRDLGISGRYAIYAGTASEWQGAEVFAQAVQLLAEQYPDFQVLYVGQGAHWEQIGQWAQKLRDRYGRDVVIQLPPTSPEAVSALLRGAEMALVSTIPGAGYDFAYPTKILAALATGTPVLYAGVGPVADDIRSYDLGVVCEHSPASVAEKMVELLSSSKSRFPVDSLRRWVLQNRSIETTAQRAARFVLSQIKD